MGEDLFPEPRGDIISDTLRAVDAIRKLPPCPMELIVAPIDKAFVMRMAEEQTHPAGNLTFGGLSVCEDKDLAPGHWCAVNSDNTIDVYGKSAERVALGIMARKMHLRVGKLRV